MKIAGVHRSHRNRRSLPQKAMGADGIAIATPYIMALTLEKLG
jgi:hypothetical protein